MHVIKAGKNYYISCTRCKFTSDMFLIQEYEDEYESPYVTLKCYDCSCVEFGKDVMKQKFTAKREQYAAADKELATYNVDDFLGMSTSKLWDLLDSVGRRISLYRHSNLILALVTYGIENKLREYHFNGVTISSSDDFKVAFLANVDNFSHELHKRWFKEASHDRVPRNRGLLLESVKTNIRDLYNF